MLRKWRQSLKIALRNEMLTESVAYFQRQKLLFKGCLIERALKKSLSLNVKAGNLHELVINVLINVLINVQ